MTKQQIEYRVLAVVEEIRQGRHVEDSWIEVKRDWGAVTARKVAAHANVSRGQPILWIIGVDEKAGPLTGNNGPPEDMATWLAKFASEFSEGVSPELLFHFAVPVGDGTSVYVLNFATDRAPYVTKSNTGIWSVAVRRGTETRDAQRSELLRILVPVTRHPILEVEGANISRLGTKDGVPEYAGGLSVYNGQTYAPGHSFHLHSKFATGTVKTDTGVEIPLRFYFKALGPGTSGTDRILLLNGPGHFLFDFFLTYALRPAPLTLQVTFSAPADNYGCTFNLRLEKHQTGDSWQLAKG